MSRENCYLRVNNPAGLVKDGRRSRRCTCRRPKHHKQGENLKSLANADQWTELVNEYFVYAEDEEGHEEKKHGETEPAEPEEEQQDPVEDEDEPLIITDP